MLAKTKGKREFIKTCDDKKALVQKDNLRKHKERDTRKCVHGYDVYICVVRVNDCANRERDAQRV